MSYSTAKSLQEVTHKDWLQKKWTRDITVTAFWTSIKILLRSLFTPRIKSHSSQEWQQRGYLPQPLRQPPWLPSLKEKAWKGSLSTRQTGMGKGRQEILYRHTWDKCLYDTQHSSQHCCLDTSLFLEKDFVSLPQEFLLLVFDFIQILTEESADKRTR